MPGTVLGTGERINISVSLIKPSLICQLYLNKAETKKKLKKKKTTSWLCQNSSDSALLSCSYMELGLVRTHWALIICCFVFPIISFLYKYQSIITNRGVDFLKAQIRVKSVCSPWCLAVKETSGGLYIEKKPLQWYAAKSGSEVSREGLQKPREIQNRQHLRIQILTCTSGKRTQLTMQEMQVQSLCQEEPLEEDLATHSSILAWKIPQTEEPGRLLSIESQSLIQLKWLGTHRS